MYPEKLPAENGCGGIGLDSMYGTDEVEAFSRWLVLSLRSRGVGDGNLGSWMGRLADEIELILLSTTCLATNGGE